MSSKKHIKKIEKRELNIENYKDIIRELATASAIHRDHNLLIDIREIEPLRSFSNIIKIIVESVKYRHIFQNKIALVITNEPDRVARARFFKVGLQPGKYQFEYFTDYEKAVDWLSETG